MKSSPLVIVAALILIVATAGAQGNGVRGNGVREPIPKVREIGNSNCRRIVALPDIVINPESNARLSGGERHEKSEAEAGELTDKVRF
jgi:hypothetical protein